MSVQAASVHTELDPQRQQFRQAMAHLGAAVNVITTAGAHGRCGITASAVCSVTDAPPTLLVCLNRSSAMHSVFDGNRQVCINVLPASLESIARHFAGMTGLSMEERFQLPVWDEGENGVPVLRGALASLQGTIVEAKDVGSHAVMFVQTTHIKVRSDGDSLIYFDRNFHRVPRAWKATTPSEG
ncbi:4-hydroxyphenylacetate 3-monooxygenase, reductase component [Caballeronia sp. Sq4a]|uniref:4-hydroxyphenylacetate 3-monooxygenase, reductase component n=1 Tax=Caballeronia sp. Sq4a TaxID=2878152 RepID=UPI0020C18557|nr:4-hydroxyphenylacetate 3-monooxygenase, reductase component [Caballeronia sp. Sq4a]